jgi:hypothetical protein
MKNTIIIAVLLFAAVAGRAQPAEAVAKLIRATERLQLRTKQADSLVYVITAGSTHRHLPTAKAVWDLLDSIGSGAGSDTVFVTARLTGIGTPGAPLDIAQQGATTGQVLKWDGTAWSPANDSIGGGGGVDTVFVTARLTGIGTPGAPLDIAQQGATVGQVLRWSGAAWVPHGTNMYDVVTTSQTVGEQFNQVFVDTLTASITLNFPPCNAANDGVKFQIVKSGPDTFAVDIEPAGVETFNDGATTKKIFSQGTAVSCTCEWNGTTGRWLFINM